MDNSEDNIRQPDAIVSEQLMEDNRSLFEKQMDEAMYLSMQELSQQRDMNRQYEERLLKEYASETIRRNELFKDFMFNLAKIGKFDKEIREIYEIIDPIIDSYCSQFINVCELDIDTHEKIFKLLSKIRTDKNAVDLVKNIILKDTVLR